MLTLSRLLPLPLLLQRFATTLQLVNQITGAIRLSDDQQRAAFTAQLTAAWQVVQAAKKRTAKQEALIRDIAEQNRAAAEARQKQLAQEKAARTAALAQLQAAEERARLHSEQLQMQTAHRAAAAAAAAAQQQQAAAAQAMLYQQQQQQQQRQPSLQQLRELLPRMEAKVLELRGQRAAAAAAGDASAVEVVEGLLQNAERGHRKAVQMATTLQEREASGAMGGGAGSGTDSVVISCSDAQQQQLQQQYPPLTEQGAQALKQRATELQSLVAAGGPQVSYSSYSSIQRNSKQQQRVLLGQ
jgi:hypothetical protein